MESLNITLVTFTYNEEYILPFFLKHYKQFCNNIIIYDNYSTDNTVQIAEAEGCTVINYGDEEKNDVFARQTISQDTIIQYSDSDFIITCDCDEFLYHNSLDILEILQQAKDNGINYFNIRGYQMFSETLPNNDLQIYESIKTGSEHSAYNKNIIFSPKGLISMNYSHGLHTCKPSGNICYNDQFEFKLLHYKFIGGVSRIIAKHINYSKKIVTSNNIGYTEERTIKNYNLYKTRAKTII